MQHFPSTPLCPVCAGSLYTRNELYPDQKYCAQHGIAMRQYDFTQFEPLFESMAKVRLALDLFTIHHVWPLVTRGDEVIVDVTRTMKNAVRAYDALRGGAI